MGEQWGGSGKQVGGREGEEKGSEGGDRAWEVSEEKDKVIILALYESFQTF